MERGIRRSSQRREFVEDNRKQVVGLAVFLVLVVRAGGEVHESIFRAVLLGEGTMVLLEVPLRLAVLAAVKHEAHNLKTVALGDEIVRVGNAAPGRAGSMLVRSPGQRVEATTHPANLASSAARGERLDPLRQRKVFERPDDAPLPTVSRQDGSKFPRPVAESHVPSRKGCQRGRSPRPPTSRRSGATVGLAESRRGSSATIRRGLPSARRPTDLATRQSQNCRKRCTATERTGLPAANG